MVVASDGTPRLLAWLDDPVADTGLHFNDGHDRWLDVPYSELAHSVRRSASASRQLGLVPGSVVVVILPAGPSFVSALLGLMQSGLTPAPLPPPGVFQAKHVYATHVLGCITQVSAAAVVTTEELLPRLRDTCERADVPLWSHDRLLDDANADDEPQPRAEHALVQFTSGSSGRARGVRVSFEALDANLSMIREWLRMTPTDGTATWLPVHHDMGLVGCTLAPISNQSDIWVLRPEQFVRSPLRYLECLGDGRAHLTAMPTFGLEFILRRVTPGALEGLDFSSWRTLIVGAERVDPDVLDRFARLLAPHGFNRKVFAPAYGLAEATLAVTGTPVDRVAPVARHPADGELTKANHSSALVSSGSPLPGVSIAIQADGAISAPEGSIGEIVVKSPSLADGYVGMSESPSLTQFDGGVLRTGDAGFVISGELYVIGRLGDAVKVRGRMVFAEDVEAEVISTGVPRDRQAVLLGNRGVVPTAVLLLEQPKEHWLVDIESTVRRVAEGCAVVVLRGRRRSIPRTSSGKPKRRELWRSFEDETLDAQRITSNRYR